MYLKPISIITPLSFCISKFTFSNACLDFSDSLVILNLIMAHKHPIIAAIPMNDKGLNTLCNVFKIFWRHSYPFIVFTLEDNYCHY